MILKHKRNTILQGVLGVTLVTLFIAFGLTRAAEKTQEKPLESKIDIATNNTTPDSPVPKPDDTAEGVFVEGRVSDSDGKPIENALVVWKTSMAQQLENRKKAVKTDANGQYRSPEMEKTKGSITVIAEGFAPEMKEFEFGSDNPPVDFALKPGKKLEIHCVDADGNPIPDVEVTLGGNVLSNGNPTPDSGWKRKANIYNSKDEGIPETNIPNTTDTNGVYRWTWAPDGELLFSFRKSGYMTSFVGPEMIGQNWMTAREEPYKVVLHKNKVIKGRIIDESTGEPIEKFQVIHAWKRGNSRRIFWNALPMPKVTVSENTFQWNIIWEFERYQFRVEAYGYLPYTSDVINVDDPDVSLNIALKPDPGQVYTVLSPEGKPLDDVKVFRTVEGNYFQTIQTSHDKKLYGNDKPTYLTDEKGQFTTPVLKENFLLFLQHPQGMAWIPREKLPQDRVIRLQRGVQVRIKTVRDTPLKLSNEIYLDLANDPMGYISYQYSIPEDDTVVIDNVMPGNYRVLQRYDYPGRHEENGTLGFVAFDIPVKIEPEKTNTLDMNLQGETVSGTVVMPDGVWRFRNVETWEYPQVSLESVESKDGRPTLLTTRIVPSEKYRDVGEFTFKNVPAGEYKFDASIRWRPDNESWGALSKIAQWDTKIKMGDVPIKLDVVLALTMTGDFIFNGEHWINNTMGDSMPLPKDSKGFLVQGESGMLRLNAKNGQGSVELINGNGTAGYGEYIKITNGGNAIQVGGPGHKVKTLLK